MTNIDFQGRSFCFTGKMLELKRTQAERETRARGGLTCDMVNDRLDYLVIGSIPSVGWKHGDYGNKIAKARELMGLNKRPLLIPESDFMAALAECMPSNSGEIDEKIVVCNYKFPIDISQLDREGLENWLNELGSTLGCHIAVHVEEFSLYHDLYTYDGIVAYPNTGYFAKCRIVKQIPIDMSGQEFADSVARGFENVRGVDGSIKWFERIEGSATYIRLLNGIPLKVSLAAID